MTKTRILVLKLQVGIKREFGVLESMYTSLGQISI